MLHWQGDYQGRRGESSEHFSTDAYKFLLIRTLLVPVLMPVLVAVRTLEMAVKYGAAVGGGRGFSVATGWAAHW